MNPTVSLRRWRLNGIQSSLVFLVAATGYLGAEGEALLPWTAREQAERLARVSVVNHGSVLWLQPPLAISDKPYIQRDYSRQYEQATPHERRAISERSGNQAAARYAEERGWTQVLGSHGRTIRQGPDSAYWDSRNGRLRAVERKGGSSEPKTHYGAKQGTNEYHVRAAWKVLSSKKTSMQEKVGAAQIIKAAQNNTLESTVIRGGERGVVSMPQVEGGWDRGSVRQEAIEIERRLVQRNPELQEVFRNAEEANRAQMQAYRIRQGFGFLGLAGTAALSWDAYQQSRAAWSMFHDPGLEGSLQPYLQGGLAASRWMEAGTLGIVSASQIGWLSEEVGAASGRLFLPIAIGTEGLSAGIAVYEFRSGRISQREFSRKLTGSGIFVLCTSGGAVIGVWFGGIGAVPGAIIGAAVGGVGQGVANVYWFIVDRGYNEKQLAAIDAAIYRHYGVGQCF